MGTGMAFTHVAHTTVLERKTGKEMPKPKHSKCQEYHCACLLTSICKREPFFTNLLLITMSSRVNITASTASYSVSNISKPLTCLVACNIEELARIVLASRA